MTWADLFYTAHGDGNGFAPFTQEKLSMGLAAIAGLPSRFLHEFAARRDRKEGTRRGRRKASGLLMVDGVLYLWARNEREFTSSFRAMIVFPSGQRRSVAPASLRAGDEASSFACTGWFETARRIGVAASTLWALRG